MSRAGLQRPLAADLHPGLVASVLLKDVHADPDQPRKSFDEKALQALSENIRQRGIQQPILVRYGDKGRITIVDGERRWRAAKAAKLASVPVLLAAITGVDEQLRLDQVSVNQLREQLKPMELARVLRKMRDDGGTINDMAATLTKQGHPQTPAQIESLAALTDLPEWGQEMIDAEEIDHAPARKILEVMDIKGIDKPLRKRLEQAIGYTGTLHAKNVGHEISRVLDEVLVSLNDTDSWSRSPVHFAFKTRCKGCEHFKPFDGRGYCQNAKLFKAHNQEAIDAGLLPGGKRPEKPKAVTGKAAEKEVAQKTEQRERSLGEKARDYLHSYLARRLQGAVSENPTVVARIAIWAALKKPGSRGTHGPVGVFYGGERGAAAAASQGVAGLESLLHGSDGLRLSAVTAAALEIICELPWRETQVLSRHFWPTLDQVWTLDAAFLDLFRKAELVHVAVNHECNPLASSRSEYVAVNDSKLWDRMKASDMKAALLTQADKLARPQILVDLYEGEIEAPYSPGYGWEGEEDYDDDSTNDDEGDDE